MNFPEISVGCDVCVDERRALDGGAPPLPSFDEFQSTFPPDSAMRHVPEIMRYYDRDGHSVSWLMGAWLHMNFDYKIVKHTHYKNGTLVSTVWLGMDHGFPIPGIGRRIPIIFETMIFPDQAEGDWAEDYQERYATEEQALDGHARAELLMEGGR